jgi:rubrerythrin
MPNFTNPFPGMRESGDLASEEIIRGLRLDLAAEQDATHIYTAQAARIKNPVVSHTLLDIANEERVHAGELLRLIMQMDPEERKFTAQGFNEVETREKLEHQIILDVLVNDIKDSLPDRKRNIKEILESRNW